MKRRNFTDSVLMVRPANFGYNPETAENNTFQSKEGADRTTTIKNRARREFDELVLRLETAGVNILVFNDKDIPQKPDAVFPNNWFTTHEDGTLITYPMYSPARRIERDPAIIELIQQKFTITQQIQLEAHELDNRFLEATGSMILNRKEGIVYSCLSERTDEALLSDFCRKMNYSPIVFNATDHQGIPVYHTNVIMALGRDFVVICMECIGNPDQRKTLIDSFKKSNLELVNISFDQVTNFAGNMLQLQNRYGDPVLAMSKSALLSLTPSQKATLENYTALLDSDISTIEK
ncbi:MAG: amidinotransferase, partial [Saprospirales bacterium]